MAEAEVKAVKLEGRERQKWALAAPDSAWVERHRRDCSDQGSFSSDRGATGEVLSDSVSTLGLPRGELRHWSPYLKEGGAVSH